MATCYKKSSKGQDQGLAKLFMRLGLGRKKEQELNCYAWVPPGLSQSMINEYHRLLPPERVPIVGSTGENYRKDQLKYQLPLQDLDVINCRYVDEAQASSCEEFIKARNKSPMDSADVRICEDRVVCPTCDKMLQPGDLGVLAPKFGEEVMWHPACFLCGECKHLLVDLNYCFHRDRPPLCVRHFDEQLKPRCSACDELIFHSEYSKAMGKNWHKEHFCCFICERALEEDQYVIRNENPYCGNCFDDAFANNCHNCKKLIGFGLTDVSYNDKHFHEKCFVCSKCGLSLLKNRFAYSEGMVYCVNCYDIHVAKQCEGCRKTFSHDAKKVIYDSKQCHPQCFRCCVCGDVIAEEQYYPRDDVFYCSPCYNQKFSSRCSKCKMIVYERGMVYDNKTWHWKCFICAVCRKGLADHNIRFFENNLYCTECFKAIYKECSSCSELITDI